MNINQLIADIESDIKRDRTKADRILDAVKAERRAFLTKAEDRECETLIERIEANQAKLERAKAIKLEEDQLEERLLVTTKAPGTRSVQSYDQRVTIGREERTYSRANDPQVKGEQFFGDVLRAYRGDPLANQRLAAHMREEVTDNPEMQQRAAGDVLVAGFPNLVIPQYMVDEFQALPNTARPFADAMRKVPLPAEGMTVELSKGNVSTVAANQSSELSAVAGTSFDADPLELTVVTAENWQQVSYQAIDRGRVTEQILKNDLMRGVDALVETTVINDPTNGLFAKAVRNEYDDASPTVKALYPKVLGAAALSQNALMDQGKPNFVLCHPRRWYWMASQVDSTFPMIGQPQIDPHNAGVMNETPYGKGYQGVLPCGLNVVTSYAVPKLILDGAAAGGTEDSLFVGDVNQAILLESPQTYVRAEQPSAKSLGLLLVVYRYYTWTFAKITSSFQAINGTGTIKPVGFDV